jgi:FkbM family methyltransferase
MEMSLQHPSFLSGLVQAESIEHVEGNLKLVTFPDGFRCYSHTSPPETEFIYNEIYVEQEYLQHGLTLDGVTYIFDVGANIGVFTLFAKSRNPQAVVHAFEPIRDTCDVLRRNVELHRLTGVHVHNVALGAQAAAQRTFTYYPHMAGNTTATPALKKALRQAMAQGAGEDMVDFVFQSETRTAPVWTLSAFLTERDIPAIDFLKIDVEGDELAVLQGIAREHISGIRQMVIEVHTPEIAQKVCALLTRVGFEVVHEAGLASQAEASNVYAINTARR